MVSHKWQTHLILITPISLVCKTGNYKRPLNIDKVIIIQTVHQRFHSVAVSICCNITLKTVYSWFTLHYNTFYM